MSLLGSVLFLFLAAIKALVCLWSSSSSSSVHVNIMTYISVSTAAALPFIVMTIVFKPYQRGVYCDDESIRYPLKPDTITHGMLAAVTITCTVIIVSSFYIL